MTAFQTRRDERSLSLMPTYRCTATCTHCGTLSSPQDKTRLPSEHLRSAIDQAAELDYKIVIFTGGEATLAGDELFALIDQARNKGLLTRLVTNAWWARGLPQARRWIGRLIDAGLSEINFSTGDQHAKFVPVERIIFAAQAANEANLPTSIMVEVVAERTITRDMIEALLMADNIDCTSQGNGAVRVIESPWMPLSPDSTVAYDAGMTADRHSVAARNGCDSVLTTTTVQADGTIGACCGIGLRLIPELHLGDIQSTTLADADATAQRDFLKRWIRVEGPERILAWAASHDNSIEWEGLYAHHCQACLRLYSDPRVGAVIREHYQEKVTDVMVAEWLLYGYEGAAEERPTASLET